MEMGVNVRKLIEIGLKLSMWMLGAWLIDFVINVRSL